MPELAEQITEIAERVGASEGIEIVEVKVLGGGKARLVRITIDHADGVTHGHCELISKEVGAVLDSNEVVPGTSYTLEVTSPGVERKLTKLKDFERFTGQKAAVVLRTPIENQKRWVGTLAGVSEGMLTLDAGPGKSVQLPLNQIEKANLKFEW